MPQSIQDWAPWWRNALTLWEIAVAAPQVVAHRGARMALAGHAPSARDRQEFARMGQEKLEAAGESLWAMGLQLWQAQQAAALKAMAAWWRPQSWLDASAWLQAAPGIAAAGMKPVHRRVTANAQRLARVALAVPAAPVVAPLAAMARVSASPRPSSRRSCRPRRRAPG